MLTNNQVIAIYSALIALLLFLAFKSMAQEHEHGVNVPDWYDNDCCNRNDCRPVEDKEVDFGINSLNQPVATYKTLSYEKSRWRKSKDERYHACFRGEVVYCIYIPTSV